jgi:hypothetical protein
VPTTLAYLAETTDIEVVGVVHNRLATIIDGVGDLVQAVLNRLQEM